MIICDRNALKYSYKQFCVLTIFEVCFRQEIPLFQIFLWLRIRVSGCITIKNLKEWYFLTKTNLKIVYNCILVHFGRI